MSRRFVPISRRSFLHAGLGGLGYSLPQWLGAKHTRAAAAGGGGQGKAKSCIVLFCWGGMSHLDTWDLKPGAPSEVRGEFKQIATSVPGIQVGEHIPLLAKQLNHLAVIRSIHHLSSAHGKGMYWNLTGHPPPQPQLAANLPPSRQDWPSLGSMVARFRAAVAGLPLTVQLPYPFVDNGTLQAGESAGWLGSGYDPTIMKTPAGKPFAGVSRNLGAAVLDLAEGIDRTRLSARSRLMRELERGAAFASTSGSFGHFRQLALDMLLTERVQQAFKLDNESTETRARYGDHICGQSVLLSRRLVESGVPIVTVLCSAGDLNGAAGDHWDTHGDNFNRLKKTMLPTFDRAASALIEDLHRRGTLDETLVVIATEFGRTPKINGGAGRDHFPNCYSVAVAGGGIAGGQVYGSSDRTGANPSDKPCGPNDLHATIFHALGIEPESTIQDQFGRPFPLSDGKVLPLFA